MGAQTDEREVLGSGEHVIDRGELASQPDPATPGGGIMQHVDAGDLCPTRVWPNSVVRMRGGRLTGAVRAGQSEHRPRLDVQRHPFDGAHPSPEGLDEVLGKNRSFTRPSNSRRKPRTAAGVSAPESPADMGSGRSEPPPRLSHEGSRARLRSPIVRRCAISSAVKAEVADQRRERASSRALRSSAGFNSLPRRGRLSRAGSCLRMAWCTPRRPCPGSTPISVRGPSSGGP